MLINCVVYQDGSKLADIPVSEISSYLSRPGCFVWVALHEATAAELAELQQEFDLHPLAVEDAQHGHQRPKVEEYADSLFAVLHLLEPDGLDQGELGVGEVDVFVGRNYVVSVRNRSAHGFVEVRQRCEREPELLRQGPGFVLYALMDAVVDRYFPVIDALEVELEKIELRIFTKGSARESIERLYALKRRLTVLKHAVAPLLEGVGKLHGGRVPPICSGLHDYFRDVYDHLIRLKQSIDNFREMATTVMSVNLSLITIQENEVTKRLAAYAALVAVPTMVAGVYGMNFKTMPELEWVWGYPAALGTMVLIDIYLVYRFKKAGWF